MKFYIQTGSKKESEQIRDIFRTYFPEAFLTVHASWEAQKGYYALTDSNVTTYRISIPESDDSVPVYTAYSFEYNYNLKNILK